MSGFHRFSVDTHLNAMHKDLTFLRSDTQRYYFLDKRISYRSRE